MSEYGYRIKKLHLTGGVINKYFYIEVSKWAVLDAYKYKNTTPCGISKYMWHDILLYISAIVSKHLGLHLFLNLGVLAVTYLQSSEYQLPKDLLFIFLLTAYIMWLIDRYFN